MAAEDTVSDAELGPRVEADAATADGPGSPPQARSVSFLIVGTPRSGTTLLQRLACEIRGVAMPPETQFFLRHVPKLLRRREFPLDAAALREELEIYARTRPAPGMTPDIDRIVDELGGTCSSSIELFDAIARNLADGGDVLGEKTPNHLLWWRPLTRAMPKLKVIVTVREARAVVASTIDMPWNKWNSHLVLAERWALEQGEVRRALKALGPGRMILLRYEDVVVDPARARSTIASFLGILDEPGQPQVREGAPGSIVMPWEWWKDGVLGPIRRDHVANWHAKLTPEEAADVAAICRKELRRFGYDVDGWGPWHRARMMLRHSPREHLKRIRFRIQRRRHMARISRIQL